MARNDPSKRFTQFVGLRDAHPEQQVGTKGLFVANNVDVDDNLRVRRRPGYAKVYDGSVGSTWGDGTDLLFSVGSSIYRLESNGETASLLGALSEPPLYLHAARCAHKLIVTTGLQSFVLEGDTVRSFGVPVPASPVVTVLVDRGRLRAGRIIITCTAVRLGGEENGPSNEVVVDVEANAAIQISLDSSLPADQFDIITYITTPDGSALHRVARTPPGTVLTILDTDTRSFGSALSTHGRGTPSDPPRTLAYFNGRLLYSVGSVLWYSDSFAYERFDMTSGFLQLDGSMINMLAPVEKGVFVGTEQAQYFLAGEDIVQCERMQITDYGAILMQPVTLERDQHTLEGVSDSVQAWVSKKGAMVGMDGGGFLNVSRSNVRFVEGRSGSAVVRNLSDMSHVLACVRY